jgi:hypothetical protein
MNLVIHELLLMPCDRHHVFIELLIGGPNQSHKVNFKELSESFDSLPVFRGKRFKVKQLFFLRQHLFRRKFGKVLFLKRCTLKEPPSFRCAFEAPRQKGLRTMAPVPLCSRSFFGNLFSDFQDVEMQQITYEKF